MCTKIELRNKLSILRAGVCDREAKEQRVLCKLFDFLHGHKINGDGKTVFCYVSFGGELDTHGIIKRFKKDGFLVAVPLTKNKIMTPMLLPDIVDLTTDKYGNLLNANLMNEVDPYVAIVPMLGFNDDCYRLGYGGGYYDRFLKDFKGVSIGVAFDEQFCKSLPIESFDMPLDYIITPNQTYGKLK